MFVECSADAVCQAQQEIIKLKASGGRPSNRGNLGSSTVGATYGLSSHDWAQQDLGASRKSEADLSKRVRALEREVERKDEENIDILKRMNEYEQGVYGLHEAVKEIKEYKKQVGRKSNALAHVCC